MSIMHSLVAAAPDDDARGCRGAEGRGAEGRGGPGGGGGPAGREGGRGGGEVEVEVDGEGGERRGYIMIERKDDYTSYTSLLYY